METRHLVALLGVLLGCTPKPAGEPTTPGAGAIASAEVVPPQADSSVSTVEVVKPTQPPASPDPKCTNPLTFPIFTHKSSPFFEETIKNGSESRRISVLIDTGWANCIAVDPALAEAMQFGKENELHFCGNLPGFTNVTIGPWAGYQMPSFDMAHTDKLPGHPPQGAVLAAGEMIGKVTVLEFSDDGKSGTLQLYNDSCDAPTAVNCIKDAASLESVALDLPFDACKQRPVDKAHLPTLTTDVSGVRVALQIDTGRDTSGRFDADVSVNKLLFDQIKKTNPTLKQVGGVSWPRKDCSSTWWEGQNVTLTLGTRKFRLDGLNLVTGAGCQPPYTWPEPAGLVGMSIFKRAKKIVLDPFRAKLLVGWR